MEKRVGLSRTVRLDWLDAVASMCVENLPSNEIRLQLDKLVEPAQPGPVERARIVDTLVRIWVKAEPKLKANAIELFPHLSSREDRLWLNYGLILAQYLFFRLCAAALGQIARTEDTTTRKMVRDRVAAEMGNLGSLERAIERLFKTWVDWGILVPAGNNLIFRINSHNIPTSNLELEKWVLSCALSAHPADAIPFADLTHLPELFPFRFSITVDALKKEEKFEVQRQGGGLEMVRITPDRA
ncbi:MAG: hypothetical protein P4L50_24070 [Anaerolineaceae bacterium]|nr:hypothetical protein [Anaerolineaceae bacterium]